MTASLHELRNEQDVVRLRLFEKYKTGNKSILSTSKDIKIAYSSLRGFMLGKRLSDLNLLKIKAWMKT
jgi:hypothetical protein